VWTELHDKQPGATPLWELATQPLMHILFQRSLRRAPKFLPSDWNCKCNAMSHDFSENSSTGCKLLHWNGSTKPWNTSSWGHLLWKSYLPQRSLDALSACGKMLERPSDFLGVLTQPTAVNHNSRESFFLARRDSRVLPPFLLTTTLLYTTALVPLFCCFRTLRKRTVGACFSSGVCVSVH
jgi:hypothetical protein